MRLQKRILTPLAQNDEKGFRTRNAAPKTDPDPFGPPSPTHPAAIACGLP